MTDRAFINVAVHANTRHSNVTPCTPQS